MPVFLTFTRRRSLSLRTDNYELACQRYASGLKELRKRIRAEHEAAKPQERLAWLPEELDEIKSEWPADFTPQEIAELQTRQRIDIDKQAFSSKSTERLAEQLAGIERILGGARENAERVKVRRQARATAELASQPHHTAAGRTSSLRSDG